MPERKKIKKCKKLACNIHKKENYVVHIRALTQALNHELILKKEHKIIQFNQKAWLKLYIDMNTKLRIDAKNDFEKDLFKLMNNSVFGKTMENVRKHRDIKLVTIDKRRNNLASEPNYHTTKHFSDNLMAIEMKKARVKMNKSIYLGMSILDISKRLMYEFGMITIDKNKKVISLFKDELGGKIMTEFVGLRAKTYPYLMDDDSEHKKAKGTKKCVTKQRLKIIKIAY